MDFIERIEMNSRRAERQKLFALLDAEFDAGFQHFFGFGGDGFKNIVHPLRDGRAAGGAKTHEAVVVGDGKNAGDDATGNAKLSKSRDIIKIIFIVKKKLGDDKISAGIGFLFEKYGVLVAVRAKNMSFRKSCNAYAKIISKVFAHEFDKFTRVLKILRAWFPVGMIARRVAA